MLCLRRLIYSCFVFCAFIFTSCFFLSSPSYATSQSFSFDSVNNPAPSFFNPDSIGFNPSYFELSGNSSVSSGAQPLYSSRCGSYYGDNPAVFVNSSGDFYEFRSLSCPDNNLWSVIVFNSRLTGSTYNFTITFYDSFPSNCPVCPTCPEVPENPYDDKLDELIHAVYVVGAILLVIYFFYIMFSWYIRS